mmetsp:Transcript_14371/g.26435  ORF Transcript_14371/g.26435 Transcript_14371/m.26435 type:complete len:205 (+) Transcript_14371:218-832(+)
MGASVSIHCAQVSPAGCPRDQLLGTAGAPQKPARASFNSACALAATFSNRNLASRSRCSSCPSSSTQVRSLSTCRTVCAPSFAAPEGMRCGTTARRARWANSSELTLSSSTLAVTGTQTIIAVFDCPFRESCKRRVSFESRHGIWVRLGSANAATHLPRADKERLIHVSSCMATPDILARGCNFSDPAKSTKLNLHTDDPRAAA